MGRIIDIIVSSNCRTEAPLGEEHGRGKPAWTSPYHYNRSRHCFPHAFEPDRKVEAP